MKTTEYFGFTQRRGDRLEIRVDWIEQVLKFPEHVQKQADGRIRKWGRIDEAGGRYLRVVLLSDGETVHNAFFDRSFRGNKYDR